MKLKYYLRGLGIGVIVTTIILVIALERKQETLTDAQIKARAAELGMVEDELIKQEDKKTATEGAIEPSTAEGVTVGQETTQLPNVSATEPATEKSSATKASTTKASTKATAKTTQAPVTQKGEDGTYVTIEIETSDWSNHVASKLQAAGLVENAADFDQYLIQNGYESIITTGTHRFKLGATYSELARELTNR